MKLLPPTKLTNHLITLIEGSETQMTIVSPSARLGRQSQLATSLEKARKRGVSVTWYYNSESDDTRALRRVGATGVAVENLHCRLYYNQSQALITSMHPHRYTGSDTVDIGYLTETRAEYAEAVAFVDEHVLPAALPTPVPVPDLPPLTVVEPTDKPTDRIISRINGVLHDFIRAKVRQGVLREEQIHYTLKGVVIEDFHPSVALVIDVSRRYDRVTLQPRGRNKDKTATYGYLNFHKRVLEQTFGHGFTSGARLKRLKCRLPTKGRRLNGSGSLTTDYTGALTRALNAAFGPLRDGISSLMSPEYHLVG